MPQPIPYYSRNQGISTAPDLGFWEDVGNNYARQYKGILRSFNATLFEDFATEESKKILLGIMILKDMKKKLSI